MASAGVNMPGGDGGDHHHHHGECRRLRRRHRRFTLRRYVPAATASEEPIAGGAAAASSGEKRTRPALSSSSSSSDGSSSDDGEEGCSSAGAAAHRLPVPAAVWPVAFGSVSLAGRMREMEDAISLRPFFFTWIDGSPIHFFAVFDGHGGPHVSALCREQMHVILAEELAAEAAALRQRPSPATAEEDAWRAALSRSFSRVDALAAVACACGRAAVPACRCPLSGQTGAIIGSTAVVALLIRDRLVVSNCGDSRAVLCRAGFPLPLSSDHKPDRPDEKARIEAAGGRVVYLNGPRVRGILAMSRALGDKYLKPEVICEPDITITERTVDDECLILASDGMWDVISNETASDVARQCLEDGSPAGSHAAGSGEAAPSTSTGALAAVRQESEPRCYRAAALLARLALGRDSSDNISVIVIDLKGRS
uniref:protein-serine/threonine phosphatase n=1 Tax=Leersia perrieri TaxID=77586 RepID=A0A0D9W294_9ORYZ